MANKEGYYREYYDENKDDINEKRRKRYKEDQEHRDRVLNHSKVYRKKNRAERGDIRMPRINKVKVYDAGDGNKLKLFTAGMFAMYMRKSVQSISTWEKKEIIPVTPYRDARGHRLYTHQMMKSVKAEIGDRRRVYPIDPGVSERIAEWWVKSGVPVGEEGDLEYILAKSKVIDANVPEPRDDEDDE